MSFPSIDSRLLNRAEQNLRNREYVSFKLATGNEKAQKIAFVLLGKSTDASLQAQFFESKEKLDRFVHAQLRGYQRVDVSEILQNL